MDLKELEYINPYTHWYYQHKLAAVLSHLEGYDLRDRELADIGAGSGFFAEGLVDRLGLRSGNCVDTGYADDQLGQRGRLTFTRALAEGPMDLYVLMDVLEHVDDDRGLLHEYASKSASGSLFVITVPAFQFLWSPHDVFLEHRRRYRIRDIESVVREVGLEIVRSRYLYAPVFPLVAGARLFRKRREPKSDLSQPPPLLNRVLLSACRGELLIPGNRLAGSSILVLAQRP